MNTAQNVEPIEYIRLPEVLLITGLSTATIYRMVVGGRFPPPGESRRAGSGLDTL